MKINLKPATALIIILVLCALLRFWRLDYPQDYVFDEVYHAFTAKMYALERYEAWVWWTSPPEGVAYEWTHPPLAKMIMAGGISIFGGAGEIPTKVTNPTLEASFEQEQRDEEKKSQRILAGNSFGWRFFGALFGVLCAYGLYLLGSLLFQNRWVGVLAAFLYTFDLLSLVQSRVAMNDIYTVTFLVYGFYFFLKRNRSCQFPVVSCQKESNRRQLRSNNFLLSPNLPLKYWLLSGVMLGCAIASKWTALFSLGVVAVYQVLTVVVSWEREHKFGGLVKNLIVDGVRGVVFFGLLPFAIYLLSYWQLFTLPIADYGGNSLSEARQAGTVLEREAGIWEVAYTTNEYLANRLFIWWGVQKQMWWYHTNLDAEHAYTSKWWTWPFVVRPVWFYVNYCSESSTDVVCLNELERWNMTNLYADIYTMGNPVLYWALIPMLGFYFYRFLYQYRWWLMAVPIFGAITLIRYNLTNVGFDEPLPLMQQLSQVWLAIVPSILLFSMLLVVFLTIMQAGVGVFDKHKTETERLVPLAIALLLFATFWLPWSQSPRIMFYYHFFPPITFFYVFAAGLLYYLAQESKAMRKYVHIYLGLVVLCFLYFYPHVTAFLLPEGVREQFWWFATWK